MLGHIYTIVAGLLPTVTALLAFLKSREASKKTDIVIIQTNGTLSKLYLRNSQLAAELSKNNQSIPPPLEGPHNEGNS
jgi:hypothetical protein